MALSLFVDDLEPLSDEAIQLGLTRCRREIGGNGYAPTLTIKDVLDRAGVVGQKEIDDAECRAAWDAILAYGERYVNNDVYGNYTPETISVRTGQTVKVSNRRSFIRIGEEAICWCYEVPERRTENPPELSQRTADTVRRVGSWRVIKTMTKDDYPHVQRRFYEEYRAWQATDAALLRGALNGNQAFKNLLEAKAMPESRRITDGDLLRSQVKQLEAKG